MEKILDDQLDNSELVFFRGFHNEEEALLLKELMDEENILHSFESSGTVIDSVIVGNGLVPKVVLKVRPSDVKRLNNAIAKQFQGLDYSEVDDHYLNQFTSDELEEILANQDEWTVEDIETSKLILKHRGIEVDEAAIKALRKKKFDKIRAGKAGNPLWMYFYAASIVFGTFFHLIFPIGGLGMSYYYAYGKENDPDGTRYFIYDAPTRRIGKYMLYIGIVVFIAEICITFYLLKVGVIR